MDTVEEALNVNLEVSEKMADTIDLWTKIYEGKAPWTGADETKSLNLGSSIASEMARLVTLEMESEITGEVDSEGNASTNDRAEYLNNQYQNIINKLRVQTEYAVAKGGMVFKPYVDGDRIAIDYVQADSFYPVEFNSSGDLIAAIFPEILDRGEDIYTRLEYQHLLPDGTYYVSNTSFKKKKDEEGLGKPIALTSVPEWEDLEAELNIRGPGDKPVERSLFSYFKVPTANNIDTNSHLGVSIYSRAVDLIKEADLQWSKILWEYEGTELAIDVSLDLLRGGTELPKGKKRLFRELDSEDTNLYKVFSPNIRDDNLFNGLNRILQRVELNVGLAYGTLSDLQVVEKTATEIIASKQRSYSTVSDIQKSLEASLDNLLYAMDFLATMYNLAKDGEYETSYYWDDSIIIDEQAEIAIMMQEIAAGLIKPEYYLKRRYGLTDEMVLDIMPGKEVLPNEYDDLE